MGWLRLTLWASILLFSLFHNVTRAQSSIEPIKARQRKLTYQIQSDGSRTLKREETGAFYRSSSGATMNTMGDQSTFIDEEGNTYEIAHRRKIANFVEHPPESIYEMLKKTPPESIKGYEMVNGIKCAILPVWVNGKPGGKEYVSLPYGLIVKIEAKVPDGSQLMVRELYDIVAAEPDPALVKIPEGYFIQNEGEQ